jgi:hypothetical protein
MAVPYHHRKEAANANVRTADGETTGMLLRVAARDVNLTAAGLRLSLLRGTHADAIERQRRDRFRSGRRIRRQYISARATVRRIFRILLSSGGQVGRGTGVGPAGGARAIE